jgi:endonuclease/exonuclease/phosphatase family metal-dependent hydrolase
MNIRTTLKGLAVAMVASLAVLPASTSQADTGCSIPDSAPRFEVGTHNVLRGAADFTRFAGVIGWQEVNDDADRAKMRRQLGDRYAHFVPAPDAAGAVPISWRAANFQLLGSGSVKVHDGRARVTPSRWINWVHLRHVRSGRDITFVNTHFISGAFKASSSFTAWRLERWKEHRAKLKQVLANLRTANPQRPVFVVGDFNHRGYLDLSAQDTHPIRLGTRTPIDQLYAGRPGHGACLTELSAAGSDHNRWRALGWLS